MDGYETDDELAARLGRVLSAYDPVPSNVVAAAKASSAWRTIDAELAVLVYDSVLDKNECVGVRGGGARLLAFTSPDVTVELEVLGAGRGLIGQVGGTTAARVQICHPDGSVSVQTDSIGHFSLPSVPTGPMTVRVIDEASGAVTQTEWVAI
jgi:hypothetical protein